MLDLNFFNAIKESHVNDSNLSGALRAGTGSHGQGRLCRGNSPWLPFRTDAPT